MIGTQTPKQSAGRSDPKSSDMSPILPPLEFTYIPFSNLFYEKPPLLACMSEETLVASSPSWNLWNRT